MAGAFVGKLDSKVISTSASDFAGTVVVKIGDKLVSKVVTTVVSTLVS